jgi:hypothetical protein
LVYSGVEARLLGRQQTILIGPGSGRAAVKAVLEALGTNPNRADVEELLEYCRVSAACLDDPAEILAELQRQRGARAA